MIPLITQEQYEDLWFARVPNTPPGYPLRSPQEGPLRSPQEGPLRSPPIFLIWFTARWCGPCKRLDIATLEAAAVAAAIPFYVCDAAVNTYTPGYCDVNAFPTFLMLKPGCVVARLKSSDTATVCSWIDTVGRSSGSG